MFIDFVRFLVTFNIKWTEFNRFLSTHIFFTLMSFTMETHLTDLPPVWIISCLSETFLWEIVSYLSSKEHSFKPKGWIVCVTVNQEHWNRLLYLVSELTWWGIIKHIFCQHTFLSPMFSYNGDSFNRFTSGVKFLYQTNQSDKLDSVDSFH